MTGDKYKNQNSFSLLSTTIERRFPKLFALIAVDVC